MSELTITASGWPTKIVLSASLQRFLNACLLLNALDLGTSTEGGRLTFETYVATRSGMAWGIQLVLLAPLFVQIPAFTRAAIRWGRSLPIPRSTRVALALVVATQLAHIATRAEIYPFSCVGMFSDVELDIGDRPRFERVYLVNGRRVNFMRESSMLFAEHDLALDVKAAWLLRLNATGLGRTYGIIADAFVARHQPPPVIAEVRYATDTGRVVHTQVMGVPRGYVSGGSQR